MIEVIEMRKDGFESDDSDEGYADDESREKYESSDPTLRLTDEEFSNSKVQRFVSSRKLYGKTEDVCGFVGAGCHVLASSSSVFYFRSFCCSLSSLRLFSSF